jgi:hypothetical protein
VAKIIQFLIYIANATNTPSLLGEVPEGFFFLTVKYMLASLAGCKVPVEIQ